MQLSTRFQQFGISPFFYPYHLNHPSMLLATLFSLSNNVNSCQSMKLTTIFLFDKFDYPGYNQTTFVSEAENRS
jgi:hypothetical protein